MSGLLPQKLTIEQIQKALAQKPTVQRQNAEEEKAKAGEKTLPKTDKASPEKAKPNSPPKKIRTKKRPDSKFTTEKACM